VVVGGGADEPAGEASVVASGEGSSEALGEGVLEAVEIAGEASIACAAWDVAGELEVAGLPWRAQATLASPTSPTTRAMAVSLASELF
jgi:hypothetical protein